MERFAAFDNYYKLTSIAVEGIRRDQVESDDVLDACGWAAVWIDLYSCANRHTCTPIVREPTRQRLAYSEVDAG